MTLGDRMKEYEIQSRTKLLRRIPVIIRLDGCHFHTWTRGLDKPYDNELMNIMQKTTKALCEQIQGCVLGYTQSDEITLVLIDYKKIESMAWYDNQVQKMCSVAASIATSAFEKNLDEEIQKLEIDAQWYNQSYILDKEEECLNKIELLSSKKYKANFDARAFNLPQYEVINNLIWRQQDATRNSVNSLAQSLFPHKELQGINNKDLQNKMLVERNVNWNNERTDFKRGACVIKDNEGKWFIDRNIPIFIEDRKYIEKLIYNESDE